MGIAPLVLNASGKWQLSGQFHALTALSAAKDTIIPCREDWKGLEACFRHFRKEKNLSPARNLKR